MNTSVTANPTVRTGALTKTDKATFFRTAHAHPGRCEYVRGRIIMHAGGTRSHWQIANRVQSALNRQLDPGKWSPGGGDLGIDTGETVRYPDVLVEPAGGDPKALVCVSPVLIVEVLSPSSEERDLDTKAEEYLALASLQAYIVASQDEAVCLVWLRDERGRFPADPLEVRGHAAAISIPGLSATLRLGEIYNGICPA